jgi:hypothetical protein
VVAVVVEVVEVVEEGVHMLDMFGMYGCLVVDLQVAVVQVSLLALLLKVNLKLKACLKKSKK